MTESNIPPESIASIYEVHLDSWMRVPEERNRPLTEDEIAPKLAGYAQRMNFTHLEFFSNRNSDPRNFVKLTNYLYENNLGVVLETKKSPALARWDTAWANETLAYLSLDPLFRKSRHDEFVHTENLASENLVRPLSHELVVQGSGSLIGRMPGDEWQKFANMRLLFAFTYALPGKKLVFMGDEFGQWNPWNPATSLDWHLVSDNNYHGKLQQWVADLNRVYRNEPALHKNGFEWIEPGEAEMSTLAFLRRSANSDDVILAAFNFTPVPRHNYRLGVPGGGFWRELLNSDALEFGGSGQGNLGGVEAAPFGWHDQSHSLVVTLPPLAAVFFKQTDTRN